VRISNSPDSSSEPKSPTPSTFSKRDPSPINSSNLGEDSQNILFNRYLQQRKNHVIRLSRAHDKIKDKLGFFKNNENWRVDLKNLRVSPERTAVLEQLDLRKSRQLGFSPKNSLLLLPNRRKNNQNLEKIGIILDRSKENL
jgi:hypothetical protein